MNFYVFSWGGIVSFNFLYLSVLSWLVLWKKKKPNKWITKLDRAMLKMSSEHKRITRAQASMHICTCWLGSSPSSNKSIGYYMSLRTTKSAIRLVRPAKTQISLRVFADRVSLLQPSVYPKLESICSEYMSRSLRKLTFLYVRRKQTQTCLHNWLSVSAVDHGLQGPGFESCYRQNSATKDYTALHCKDPSFIIIVASSRNDLNNVERVVHTTRFIRHERRNKGIKHSWKKNPAYRGIWPRFTRINIQYFNHWAKESTPWRGCQWTNIYIHAMPNLPRQIIEGRSARP